MSAEEITGSGGSSIEMWLSGEDDQHSEVALQGRVWEELRREPLLVSADLEVEVMDHVAVLSGRVNQQIARTAAERAARRVEGVREVENRIQVRFSSSIHGRFTPADV